MRPGRIITGEEKRVRRAMKRGVVLDEGDVRTRKIGDDVQGEENDGLSNRSLRTAKIAGDTPVS